MALAHLQDDQTLLSSAHALRAHILACADQIEADRRLPTPLVDALKAAKIFRMAMPHAWGGLQLDPIAQFEVLEALTMADASTGWCAYIGACSGGFLTAFLDQSVAREMYPQRRHHYRRRRPPCRAGHGGPWWLSRERALAVR